MAWLKSYKFRPCRASDIRSVFVAAAVGIPMTIAKASVVLDRELEEEERLRPSRPRIHRPIIQLVPL